MTASDNRINSSKSNTSALKNTSKPLTKNAPLQPSNSKVNVGTSGGFYKGQVIKGEIIDLRDKDVKIQLEDSKIIQAKMDNSQNVSIGDRASFQVTSASLNSMSLEMLSKSSAFEREYMLEKALDEAGLPHSDKNLTAVRELFANQLPINKSAIMQLLRQSVLYKNASLETLALMNKLNMPMNEVTTSQFEAYKNYEHRILYQLEAFTDMALSDNLTNDSAMQLINILQNDTFHATSDNLAPLHTILSPEERLNLTDLLDSFGISDAEQSGFISGNISISKAAHIILDTVESLKEYEDNIKANQAAVIDDNSQDDYDTALNKQNTSTFSGIINNKLTDNLPEALNRPEVYTLLENFISTSTENLELSSFLSLPEREQLIKYLKPLNLTYEFENQIKNGDATADEMLPFFDKLLSTSGSLTEGLLSNKAFQSIMNELLISRWTLTPNDLTKPDALDRYYEKLDKDLENLSKGFADTSSSSAGGNNGSASNLRDNIDFMKTLNQMFIYCQMPIKLSSNNVHSELYVYTNKKSLLANKNQIKVLLHLDMTYLGPLDVHVELNNKTINTKFYVEQEDSTPIIADNIYLLTKSLENKGFTHNSEILKREKEINIVEDFIAPKDIGLEMKRYTFDRRA